MKTIDLKAEEQVTAVALTRREKLLRWADLVRVAEYPIPLFHLMERWAPDTLKRPVNEFGYGERTAFGIAFGDPIFKAVGLEGGSVRDAMNFFELSQAELHEFSCDCGGEISNAQMGDRIARLAGAPLTGH
jgi:hypothetical protein